MRTDAVDQFDPLGLKEIADRVRDAWSTMILAGFNASGPLDVDFNANTVWRSVNVYKVDALGKATGQSESAFASNVKGGSGSMVPPQCAIVVTTLTGAPGRSARGRMFLGGLSNNGNDFTGRINPLTRDRLAKGVGGMFTQLRSSGFQADVIRPVVVSPTKNDARKITAVQVGDVYDTMRSRRNKLVEARIRQSVDE
jgi:hypothetical protein